jgi:branched-chain amino acid transport system substrate-binding protein
VPYSIGETDFSAKAKALIDKVLDTVMFWGIPSHVTPLLEEFKKHNDSVKFRSMEFHPNLLGSGVLADPAMWEAAGELWEGAIVASGVPNPDSDEPGVVRAREIMSKYAPDVPFGSYALMGLVRAELLVEGLKRAGPSITRLRLVLALESLEEWSDNFLGQPITINKDNHQGFDSVQLMKIEGGKHVSVTGWVKP